MNPTSATAEFIAILKSHPNWKAVESICQTLVDNGFEAVLAGGCVRDALRGLTPHDFDIATSARPDDVERLFNHTVPVGKSFGVILVVEKGVSFEVASFRSDGPYQDSRHPTSIQFSSIQDDALRRDFTVNALFYEPSTNRILDFVQGQRDLAERVIRAVGDPVQRFTEDALRIMRAIRFLGQFFDGKFTFRLDSETERALSKLKDRVKSVSRERITMELDKILDSRGAVLALGEIKRFELSSILLAHWSDWLFGDGSMLSMKLDPAHSNLNGLNQKRLLFFWPLLLKLSHQDLELGMRTYRYGREFLDLILWSQSHLSEFGLGSSFTSDSNGDADAASLKASDEVDREWAQRPTIWKPTPSEEAAAKRLMVWLDDRALLAIPVFDLWAEAAVGKSEAESVRARRQEILLKRGLSLGDSKALQALKPSSYVIKKLRVETLEGSSLGAAIQSLLYARLLYSKHDL